MMEKEDIIKPIPYKLRENISEGKENYAISMPLRNIIQKDVWCLGDRVYRDLNAGLFFEVLAMSAIKVLWLDLNKRSAIIREIVTPDYPNLKNLYLGDNNISSLDPLVRLSAPNIEKLFLNHNKIVCLKSLPKAHLPELIELNLNGNFIEDQSPLAACNYPKAEKIFVNYPGKQQRIFSNLWFIRAEFGEMTTIKSNRTKLATFTRKSYLLMMDQIAKMPPQDLFKTFEK